MLSGGKAKLVKGKNKMRAMIMTGIWKQKSSLEMSKQSGLHRLFLTLAHIVPKLVLNYYSVQPYLPPSHGPPGDCSGGGIALQG